MFNFKIISLLLLLINWEENVSKNLWNANKQTENKTYFLIYLLSEQKTKHLNVVIVLLIAWSHSISHRNAVDKSFVYLLARKINKMNVAINRPIEICCTRENWRKSVCVRQAQTSETEVIWIHAWRWKKQYFTEKKSHETLHIIYPLSSVAYFFGCQKIERKIVDVAMHVFWVKKHMWRTERRTYCMECMLQNL